MSDRRKHHISVKTSEHTGSISLPQTDTWGIVTQQLYLSMNGVVRSVVRLWAVTHIKCWERFILTHFCSNHHKETQDMKRGGQKRLGQIMSFLIHILSGLITLIMIDISVCLSYNASLSPSLFNTNDCRVLDTFFFTFVEATWYFSWKSQHPKLCLVLPSVLLGSRWRHATCCFSLCLCTLQG